MQDSVKQELSQACKERADFYRLLASLYFKEVSEEFLEQMPLLAGSEASGNEKMDRGFKALRQYSVRKGPDPRTDLAVDYARVFLSAGIYEGDAANPYESIYTSEEGLIMQDARDEVRLIYLKQAINVNDELNLPEDHLSFELEFLAIMADRVQELLASSGDAGEVAANLGVQRAFIDEHLLNWLPMLAQRVKDCAEQPFYPAILDITQGFLEEDRALLEEMLSLVEQPCVA